jgi:hypothetical protein
MSHVTTLKSQLKDMDAVRAFIESEEMKQKGFSWEVGGKIRYYCGATHPSQHTIKCPGRYDIGIADKGGNVELQADWGYADFYKHFGKGVRGQQNVQNELKKGQNEFLFRREAQKKRWKVRKTVEESGKIRLEATI